MPEEQMSFVDKQKVKLAAERDGQSESERPREVADPADRVPVDQGESVDEQNDDDQALLASEEDVDTEDEYEEELDSENPSEADPDEDTETVDWEKRYKDTQAALSEATRNRKEIETGLASEEAETLKHRFELEDGMKEVRQRAEFWLNTMTGNANQYRNINWSAVDPSKVQGLQQQAQQALGMEQQAQNAYQQHVQQQNEQMQQVRSRDAQIANMRLRRTIPDWGNEKLGELREYASSRGYDPKLFSEITSAPLIEMIEESFRLNNPSQKVERTAKKRTKGRPNRQAKRVDKSKRGDVKRANDAFAANPGQKGRFAAKRLAEFQADGGRN